MDFRVASRVRQLRKTVQKQRFTVATGGGSRGRPDRRADEEALLDEVDRVLDKISASGLASLSDEEKKILDEVSRRYRQN